MKNANVHNNGTWDHPIDLLWSDKGSCISYIEHLLHMEP